MSNVIELPQYSDSTRQVLRPEIVDNGNVTANDEGAIVRAFIVAGTFVEKTLRYIALHGSHLGRYLGRNVISFVRAIPLWLSDASYKIRWSRGSLALSQAKRQTPGRAARAMRWAWELRRFPKYVCAGMSITCRVAAPWLSDAEGREDVIESRDSKKHYHRQAKETGEESAWEAHRKAQRSCSKLRREHAAVLAQHWTVVAAALAGVGGVGFVLWTMTPRWMPLSLGTAISVATIVRLGVVGARAASLLVEDHVPGSAPKHITCELVERAFTRLRIAALNSAPVKCLLPGIIEMPDGDGWKVIVELPGGVTAEQDVIPHKARFASAIGGIKAEQVIMREGHGTNILVIEVSTVPPSQRKPASSPYLSASTVRVTDPIEWGTDALGSPTSIRQSHATLIVGESLASRVRARAMASTAALRRMR